MNNNAIIIMHQLMHAKNILLNVVVYFPELKCQHTLCYIFSTRNLPIVYIYRRKHFFLIAGSRKYIAQNMLTHHVRV